MPSYILTYKKNLAYTNMPSSFSSAAGRGRTGTGITTHGILSPGRLPIPPRRHAQNITIIHICQVICKCFFIQKMSGYMLVLIYIRRNILITVYLITRIISVLKFNDLNIIFESGIGFNMNDIIYFMSDKSLPKRRFRCYVTLERISPDSSNDL